MKINIHAGHNPEGKIACGAIGILNESREARIIKDKVIQLLRAAGHDVLDCTVDNGVSQGDVLRKIVEKCNSRLADLDISIHLNSGRNDYVGDGSIGGTEVFIYSIDPSNKTAIVYGKSIVEKIGDLGFRIRDDAIPDHIKTDSQLYVLRNTKAPALLVECCFVDDKDDADLYNADKMAQAIADGVIAIAGSSAPVQAPTPAPTSAPVQTSRYVGENVSFNKIYGTAASTNALNTRVTSGTITKVLPGKANPYLINGGTGWVNDGCITGGGAVAHPTVNYYPSYNGSNSITQSLRAIGVDSSMAHRKQIASANGIGGYAGTYTQNVTMLTLLKQGRLISA